MVDRKKAYEVALRAVKEATELCIRVESRIHANSIEKEDRSPVTIADFGSQALICSTLKSAFPAIPIIAEENADSLRLSKSGSIRDAVVQNAQAIRSGASEAEVLDWIDEGGESKYHDLFWTLDPIDGTKGYLRGDQYAVALALVEHGKVILAVLGCPRLKSAGTIGVIAAAAAGQGTTIYRLADMSSMGQIRVSDTGDPALSRMSESVESGHTSHSESDVIRGRLGTSEASIRMDSQAKYIIVAQGDADIYMRLPSKPGYIEKIWDHAAGSLIVEEAGGTVTDVSGTPLDFTHGYRLDNNRGVVVTNGRLHSSVLAALRSTE